MLTKKIKIGCPIDHKPGRKERIMGMFAEVRNDYRFEEFENGIKAGITIDVWETDDDNEEGKVAATVILSEHNDIIVVWHLNYAREDQECLLAIEEAKNILKEEI